MKEASYETIARLEREKRVLFDAVTRVEKNLRHSQVEQYPGDPLKVLREAIRDVRRPA